MKACFVDGSAGRIFVLARLPDKAKRCVLFVPPFGEEMNKCRRQFSEVSQALAAQGVASILVDLYGTGDSAGEFVDARWDIWKRDLTTAIDWAGDSGLEVDSIVATRLGCVLMADFLRTHDDIAFKRTVFWQPVTKGKQFMTQFLRLRVAASMMAEGGEETVDSLRERIRSEGSLEIAGYQIPAELLEAIDGANLVEVLNERLGHLEVFEIGRAGSKDKSPVGDKSPAGDLSQAEGSSPAGGLSPAGRKLVQAASDEGIDCGGQKITGEPFWSSTEIVVNNALRDATVHWLLDEGSA